MYYRLRTFPQMTGKYTQRLWPSLMDFIRLERTLSTNALDSIEESNSSTSPWNIYHLAKHREYGNLREQMIRDRIVIGIRDFTLSERLHLDPELTIDKAIKLVR